MLKSLDQIAYGNLQQFASPCINDFNLFFNTLYRSSHSSLILYIKRIVSFSFDFFGGTIGEKDSIDNDIASSYDVYDSKNNTINIGLIQFSKYPQFYIFHLSKT
jgi:hypothetical protein